MALDVPHPNTRGFAKQRNDNIEKSGTTSRTPDVNRRREDKQARKARLKAKHRGTHKTDRCITVNTGKEQPRNPDQLDEQLKENDPNQFTSSIKLFDELPPPGEDEPRTWSWQLRMLVWRRLNMSFTEYCKIDWKSEFDFQKFQRDCVESDPCYIYWYRKKQPVPIPCLKHSQGTNLMWRRHGEEYREHLEASFAAEKKEREEKRDAEWAEECERIERAIAESPDLWLRDKRWEPVGPGVALIAGTMVQDIATFFCDCDITVEEANLFNENRKYTKEGRDIVAQIQSRSDEVDWSTTQQVQVRISIDKFRRPGHVGDLEHAGHPAVRNLKGRCGNTSCAVILFLGRTGQKIDDQCCYWLYSASGFSGPDLSKLGQNDSFRMVRLSKVSHLDHIDFMRCFGLRMGKERVEAFSDGFNSKVTRTQVTPLKWEDFRQWNELPDDLKSVSSVEDDDPGHDDPLDDEPRGDDQGGEDPGEEYAGDYDSGEDDTVEDDSGGDDPVENDPAEDYPAGYYPAEDAFMENAWFEDAQDIDFDLFVDRSELNEIANKRDEGDDPAENDPAKDDPVDDDESDDEPDNGFRLPVPGWKSGIPKDLGG